MHETGLCEGVVDAIVRRAHGRPVGWARVRIGGHPVDPEVVGQGVAVAAMGTEAEGLEVEVVLDPLRAVCGSCGADEPVNDAPDMTACRRCGGLDVTLAGSDHAVLEAVGYRQMERGAGGPAPTRARSTPSTPLS